MPSVLITGANRGLGLEFARQYGAAGWRVFACCRKPDTAADLRELADASRGRTTIHPLDVADRDRIPALADELRGEPVDVLLNNAGVYGPSKMAFGQFDYAAWAEVFAVNVLGPTRMIECFVDHVVRSKQKKIVCLSSLMGSITRNTSGRHYLYRSTKAALNMVVKGLAVDLRDRGATVVVLHPGWVRTDMGGADADLSPEESIRGMIRVVEGLGGWDTGKFLSYDGSELPW
jgi:NAD(P)-dependent dehydrogenase (short-subunit alcohol dehydrogenase family)